MPLISSPPPLNFGILLALLIVMPSAVTALTGLKEEGDHKQLVLGRSRDFFNEKLIAQRERRVDCSLPCQHVPRGPVCGTNGKTYRNLCDLDMDICRKVKVSLKHDGECTLEEKCLDERRAKLEEFANGENVYIPNCLEDGSYAPVQCHNLTTYCWCSSLDGVPLGEAVQSGTLPSCPDQRGPAQGNPSPSSSSGRAAAERCNGRARNTFITRLSKTIETEYKRERNPQRLTERKLLRRALKWKFAGLDKNNDRKLQRKDYRRLMKTVKKFIRPKKCAKLFPRLCDVNGDKILTEREWVTCFTKQGEKRRPSDDRCLTPPCRKKPTTPRPFTPSCERERARQGVGENTDDMSIPVYKCQANGRYEPMQCFKDNTDVICICVDEWTGNSLDGTGVRNGTPDCTRPMPHARAWKGCRGEAKMNFMKYLQEFLFNKVEGGKRALNGVDRSQSVEVAARYHFSSLDTDNSNYIEGREKKMMKKHFKSNPQLRRCGKKMTMYCDVNYDRRVSIEEWMACVTWEHNETDNNVGGGNARTFDENPLHKYLVPEDGQTKNRVQ